MRRESQRTDLVPFRMAKSRLDPGNSRAGLEFGPFRERPYKRFGSLASTRKQNGNFSTGKPAAEISGLPSDACLDND
jgi:hypothetical protein